jgi:hypothetical protein
MNVKMKTKKFVNIMRKKECVKNLTIDIDYTVEKRVDETVHVFVVIFDSFFIYVLPWEILLLRGRVVISFTGLTPPHV